MAKKSTKKSTKKSEGTFALTYFDKNKKEWHTETGLSKNNAKTGQKALSKMKSRSGVVYSKIK